MQIFEFLCGLNAIVFNRLVYEPISLLIKEEFYNYKFLSFNNSQMKIYFQLNLKRQIIRKKDEYFFV